MPKKKPVYDNESITSLKGADRVRLRPGVILAPMASTAVSIPFSRFCRTPSMKPAPDTEQRSPSRVFSTARLRSSTTAAVSRWTLTRRNSATTGNWFSVNCMQAANTTMNPAKIINIRWGLTVWVFAPHSTPPNIWTWISAATANGLRCILNTAKMWAAAPRALCQTRYGLKNPLAPRFAGVYRYRYSR